ncbi:shikimate dehydrogenase [Deinococcus sp.]|uniref:shikimate dehydrogenase n=1 Tax=Deinococcus sp. TaxID=47478 RepID=UPI003C79A019
MTSTHDTPLALLGYPQGTGRALRDLGLTAVSVPEGPLLEVLHACTALAFQGALVAANLQAGMLAVTQPDSAAQRAGSADVLAFVAGRAAHATCTLPDALLDALEDSGYPVRGARALLIGQGGDLGAGLALTRLGLGSLTLAAASHPEAEALARGLPASLKAHVTSRSDPALVTLAERADLIVLTAGPLPPGVLQPFHALLDLTGRAGGAASRAGSALVPLTRLPELRLARRLHHATGQRFAPDVLKELAGVLG